MINLERDPKIPASLKSPEIQKYISDLEDFKAGILSVKPQAPTSYRTSDLLEAFDNSFFSKCYLTERKFANSWAMDVEHFVSKSEDPTKTYDWDNLLPCDHDANMQKPKKTPEGGYLDPCKDEPESQLIQVLLMLGSSNFKAVDSTDSKSKNTANLLNEIHNGKSNNLDSIKKTASLRDLITTKHEKVKDLIMEWQDAINKKDIIREIQNERLLRTELSRKEAFTMLIRSSPYVRRYLPVDFLD